MPYEIVPLVWGPRRGDCSRGARAGVASSQGIVAAAPVPPCLFQTTDDGVCLPSEPLCDGASLEERQPVGVAVRLGGTPTWAGGSRPCVRVVDCYDDLDRHLQRLGRTDAEVVHAVHGYLVVAVALQVERRRDHVAGSGLAGTHDRSAGCPSRPATACDRSPKALSTASPQRMRPISLVAAPAKRVPPWSDFTSSC